MFPSRRDAIAMIIMLTSAACAGDPSTSTVTSGAVRSESPAESDASTNGCDPACGAGFTCCGGTCVDLANDPRHCGACATSCAASTNFCAEGACTVPACESGVRCAAGSTCCGDQCCASGMICCVVGGAGIQHMACSAGPACPSPCPTCR